MEEKRRRSRSGGAAVAKPIVAYPGLRELSVTDIVSTARTGDLRREAPSAGRARRRATFPVAEENSCALPYPRVAGEAYFAGRSRARYAATEAISWSVRCPAFLPAIRCTVESQSAADFDLPSGRSVPWQAEHLASNVDFAAR